VYHLAAISLPAVCGSKEPTAAAIATNVGGTRALVNLVESLPTRPRIVFSSSCYVYGAVSRDHPITPENAPEAPNSAYGRTKLAAEQVLLSAARSGGPEVVIARSFQHTGPRQSPLMMIPGWARQLAEPGDQPVHAICLNTFLDLSDVRDVVRAYRMLAIGGHSKQIYNVGSGVCRRSGELLDLMRRLCDSSKSVVESLPGCRQHPVADLTRIKEQIGWQPRIPIEQTLRDVMEDWKQQTGVTP
jgi:GDP-4-dehydro-6-deoxy-D-mannose reductase